MNLIQRPINDDFDIMLYRRYQYDLIIDLIEICFNYISKFGYEINNYKIDIIDDDTYTSKNQYLFDKIRISINNSTSRTNFLELDIPKLINDVFFKLKGVHYIPLIYILDEPITFKKHSVKLYSLFKPITLFFNDDRITFNGNNIPVSRFMNLYTSDINQTKEYCQILNTTFIRETREESIEKLISMFKCDTEEEVRTKIDDLFLDEWTSDLYSKFYKLENITFEKLLKLIIDRFENDVKYEFNDLNFKRLVFIELLLDPLFKAVGGFLYNYEHATTEPNRINIKANAVIQHFYLSGNIGIGSQKKNKGLCGSTVYSLVNGYTGVLSNKASFKNPKSQSLIPQSVSSIHESHKNKICQVTISNKSPGVLSSLIPDQKIDLRYGIFL